jgi:hypothetical protein
LIPEEEGSATLLLLPWLNPAINHETSASKPWSRFWTPRA